MSQVVRILEDIYANLQDEDISQNNLTSHSLPTVHEEDIYATDSEASKAATFPHNLPVGMAENAGVRSI